MDALERAPVKLLFLLLLLAALPSAGTAGQYTFSVNVNLVVLHVSVRDHKGNFVSNLDQKDFHVYEDGVQQHISLFRHEDAPVAVGLVVDNSGSMRRKLPEVVAAAFAFARSSNLQDEMFVVGFNEHVYLGLPPDEAFTSNPEELREALSRISARGRTALYDAIAVALEHLKKSHLRKKVLIVVSDGGDNASTHTFQQVLRMAEQSNTIIYTVGLFDEYDTDRNPGVLKRLAKATGGQAYFPPQVHDVTSRLEVISKDIRNQYTIGYLPTNQKRDGSYRKVRVRVTAPHSNKWSVRTRPGYYAPQKKVQKGETQ